MDADEAGPAVGMSGGAAVGGGARTTDGHGDEADEAAVLEAKIVDDDDEDEAKAGMGEDDNDDDDVAEEASASAALDADVAAMDEEGVFAVERILGRRYNTSKRRVEYLIVWKGFEDKPHEDTWEPKEHLSNSSLNFVRQRWGDSKPSRTAAIEYTDSAFFEWDKKRVAAAGGDVAALEAASSTGKRKPGPGRQRGGRKSAKTAARNRPSGYDDDSEDETNDDNRKIPAATDGRAAEGKVKEFLVLSSDEDEDRKKPPAANGGKVKGKDITPVRSYDVLLPYSFCMYSCIRFSRFLPSPPFCIHNTTTGFRRR